MMGRWTFLGVGLVVLSMLFGFHPKGLAEERYTVKPGDTLYPVRKPHHLRGDDIKDNINSFLKGGVQSPVISNGVYGISKSFGVTIQALKDANRVEGSEIRPKQVLLIPTQREKQTGEATKKISGKTAKKPSVETVKRPSSQTESYVVQKGDNLYAVSKRAGLSIEEIKKMNQLHSTALKIGQTLILPKQKTWTEEKEEVGDSEEIIGERLAEGDGDKQEASEPLGKWSNPEERNVFVRVVKTFLGAPYRLGGSTLKGIDCSAFVKKIYEVFNIHLPRTAREQFCIGKKVEKEQLEEGDLVFFKTRRANNAHVGIYIGNNEFVHASNRNKEVKVDNLDTPYFSKRFLKGVRIKELERET